ncbi:hypothetical protein [Corynebacterium sp. HMSC078H07]|uniref:hypothetical protein n=1 Tax=Corynebacterium sp. HMSC078H07 TaxID=1739379 RepID=UPI0008A47BB0|nr:hypothetical protein [Corynebacterium sp. HMSC078H07]OFR68228.1 hypothetical protein HMPREF2875_06435 [Corynebacterium sp. HMSC078H07]
MNIREWNLKHPKEVLQLLGAQEKLEQVINTPAPDTTGLFNEKTLEKTLDDMVSHALVSGHERVRAVNHARSLIETKLFREIQSNLDSYLDQAFQSFDKAAHIYESNIYELPSTPFTADQALGFSPEEREAYDKVVEAAGTLSYWMHWALELKELPGQGLGAWSKFHTIVSPETVGGLMVLQLEDATTGNPAWDRTLPVVARALREGASLRLSSPTAARHEAEEVEADRQSMSDEAHRVLRANLGY